ncbi:MAG: hypothetical protein GXP49_10980 [Deltaproteobacteria bacterium]|nr:hypothetical protein [Deltaproteobacteria bacterium]
MSNVSRVGRSQMAVTTTRDSGRKSPRTDFGAKLGNTLRKAGNMVSIGGAIMAPVIPAAGLVSAAVSGMKNMMPTALETGKDNGTDDVLNRADQGADSMFEATKKLQEMNHEMNLEYLQLQQQVQQEERNFSTMSQLMASRHQTAMRAIQNMGS